MWKITNLNNKKYTIIQNETIINIGNIKACDIQIDVPKSTTTLIQVILEYNYIFVIHENVINCSIHKYELKLYNNNFIIEYLEDNHEVQKYFYNADINYEDIQSIYSSHEFSKYLSLIQAELSQNKIQNNKLTRHEIASYSCKKIDSFFWSERNVFEKAERDLYKKFIWILCAQICEYGLLTYPLVDNQVSEIMVNEYKKIYFEKDGVLYLSPLKFNTESDLSSLIERICSSVGRRIDESMPYCDARLKDGSRIHAIIPPLALNGPCLTIRKFPNHAITAEKLIEIGSISKSLFSFLQEIVSNKKNILISGGTGTGKTTLLNCLSSFIPHHERIITIEDSAELKLQQEHVIRLESRLENVEKKGAVTMRDLVKNSLRMRPDRIIVGECRGGEALDMLQAMNTGHDGSMTTVHANSPVDALRRLETLVLFAEYDLPSRAIREQISSAIHYVIQQTRLANGHRCVTEVDEVIGLCDSTGKFLTKRVYTHC